MTIIPHLLQRFVLRDFFRAVRGRKTMIETCFSSAASKNREAGSVRAVPAAIKPKRGKFDHVANDGKTPVCGD
jgi:hypothetical protein